MRDIWKEETIIALNHLGGVAHLDEIFDQIIKQGNIDLSNSKTPKKTLSRTLQIYSFSTDYGKDNIFYSVYGVEARKGIWGLVDNILDTIKIDFTQDDLFFPEGKKVLKSHVIRERNPALIKKAKENFKKNHNGQLYCEVCGFNFYQTYGELGENFIEAHHIKPISEMKNNEETNVVFKSP